jgi:hypothetical protein
MPQQPDPADPGPDEDLAWLDRDPMTAEEREAWLDWVCEHDEPRGEEDDEDYIPLTAAELAEIREAADELLAVKMATSGRRGPGQPGSARVFPGESSSPAVAFGPGMALDVLPGCAQLAVTADAAAREDGQFAGVSEGELVGLLCAWDRPTGLECAPPAKRTSCRAPRSSTPGRAGTPTANARPRTATTAPASGHDDSDPTGPLRGMRPGHDPR